MDFLHNLAKYGFEGLGVLVTIVPESLNLSHNLKGCVVNIRGVTVIMGNFKNLFLANIHLYICLGKVKKYY